jgi:hypothetical protein
VIQDSENEDDDLIPEVAAFFVGVGMAFVVFVAFYFVGVAYGRPDGVYVAAIGVASLIVGLWAAEDVYLRLGGRGVDDQR